MQVREQKQPQKLVQFYKYESEISLEGGRVFIVNKRGQIMEVNMKEIKCHDES